MAAVASPALRLRPRPRTAAPSPPRCRLSSSAYSYSKARHALRRYGNHDGRFHIKRITSFAAMDKQESITSPTTDALPVEETDNSTEDSPASGSSSYFTERGNGKSGNNDGFELDDTAFDHGNGLALDWTSSFSYSCPLSGNLVLIFILVLLDPETKA
ncbi:hypothetical protein [Oryza sativa Japonica Group]|uniref:Uncharacterized protein n=1 Tax=Oryza sativa subsp. japonica TaxID=39947 RepID=Q5N9S0_ORYSJ|nr:hypothetical protein [Oryza sativa Japonica Group]BAD81795.1 hypothetical protein [Oryza sativa Japonica Group]